MRKQKVNPVPSGLHAKVLRKIDDSVNFFMGEEIQDRFVRTKDNLSNLLIKHPKLQPFVHSVKSRLKDPTHLREKLIRKAFYCKKNGTTFDIDKNNLLDRIYDLAGVRILHLHTEQMSKINEILIDILNEERYIISEGPIANTWDIEYENFFKELGIQVTTRDSMYTSVHYIISANTKFETKCELQVRTLMEEVWGEVSHKINYPNQTESVSCQEQLKVLARVTSGCTRLVDSIFKSYDEHYSLSKKK